MALVVTAALLYIPAMTLPIMQTVTLGTPMDSTVVGGVVVIWNMGSYPIAVLIFVASVFVPVGKLIALTVLCWFVTYGKGLTPQQQTVLYRVTEFVGKWSMIDVFVVTILVALIKLGDVLSFYPGVAALTFASVVIITMVAAELFDPRLIWDKAQEHE
jgi:paraquat-inducible protein A